MPTQFKTGDWVRHRKAKIAYQVVHTRPDGHLIVQDRRGFQRHLTRPEEYRHATPPNSAVEGFAKHRELVACSSPESAEGRHAEPEVTQ